MKICARCSLELPLEAFHRRKSAADGMCAACKGCEQKRRQAWRAQNPDKVSAGHAAYRAANRERLREKARVYVTANRERQLAAVRAWWRANPEKVAEYSHRRRAQMAGTMVGAVDVELLWTGTCGICGNELDREIPYPDPLSKSLDHIVPLVQGGAHTQHNLQWAHLLCNVRKGGRPGSAD